MCNPAAIAMTAMSGFSALQQGKTANAQANMQAQQADYEATIEQQNALRTAAMIRRAGAKQVGQANAAYAGAGVKIGEGSAGETERQITQDYEHDAFQALLEGSRRASGLRLDASMQRTQGKLAQSAGLVNAVGNVLQGGYSALKASGWRTNGPGWAGTQAPAPVESRPYPKG
jgi:hypothetical protein